MGMIKTESQELVKCLIPYCGKSFKTERGLDQHWRLSHSDGGCPICFGGQGSACYSHFLP